MPQVPPMEPDQLLRVLGFGGDPAAGRPGVNVSPPGNRALPGAGQITTGRAYNPSIGPQPVIQVQGRPTPNIRPSGRADVMSTLLAQQPGQTAPQGGAETAPAAAAETPTTNSLLDQLGMAGARPYLRAAAAGMQAPGSPSAGGAFMSGFAGAQAGAAASEAAAAKQAREDAKDAREMAFKEKELASEERRATMADKRAAAAAGREETRMGWEKQDRARQEQEDADGTTDYNRAEEAAAKHIKTTLGEPDKALDPEKYAKDSAKIFDDYKKRRKVAAGDGSWDRPLELGFKFQEMDKQASAEVLSKGEGQYARIKGQLYKSGRDATGKISWLPADEAAEKAAQEGAAEAAKPGFLGRLFGG